MNNDQINDLIEEWDHHNENSIFWVEMEIESEYEKDKIDGFLSEFESYEKSDFNDNEYLVTIVADSLFDASSKTKEIAQAHDIVVKRLSVD